MSLSFTIPGGKPRLRLLCCLGLVLFVASVASGQSAETESPDVVNLTTALGTGTRLIVYGLSLLTLCLLSFVIPDAPLLAYIFSMPIAQFGGLGVALTLLQCLVVCGRTRGLQWLVPSWPLLVLLLCMAASPTWALYPQESLQGEQAGVYATFQQLPLALAAAALLRSGLTTLPRLLWALALGCIPGCFFTIKNALAGVRYNQDQNEYYMGLIQPDIFSPMLVMAGLFLLCSLSSPVSRLSKRSLAGLLLLLISISLLLTGIRSGWVAFGLAALLLLPRMRSWVALASLFVLGTLLCLAVLSSALNLNLAEKVASRWTEDSMTSGQARLEYWEVATTGFLKRPVLGIGWGGFPQFSADNTLGKEAATHNIFVRVLCELGLVGLALFLAWVGAVALRLRRNPEGTLTAVLLLAVLVQGVFLDHFLCHYFWLFLGICDGVRAVQPCGDMDSLAGWRGGWSNPTNRVAA